MGDIEFGKCDICGEEAQLSRTYFKYRIGECTCCGCTLSDGTRGHFVKVIHCDKCTPSIPTIIHPVFQGFDGKEYKSNITNVFPFEINGDYTI